MKQKRGRRLGGEADKGKYGKRDPGLLHSHADRGLPTFLGRS